MPRDLDAGLGGDEHHGAAEDEAPEVCGLRGVKPLPGKKCKGQLGHVTSSFALDDAGGDTLRDGGVGVSCYASWSRGTVA